MTWNQAQASWSLARIASRRPLPKTHKPLAPVGDASLRIPRAEGYARLGGGDRTPKCGHHACLGKACEAVRSKPSSVGRELGVVTGKESEGGSGGSGVVAAPFDLNAHQALDAMRAGKVVECVLRDGTSPYRMRVAVEREWEYSYSYGGDRWSGWEPTGLQSDFLSGDETGRATYRVVNES